MPIIYSVVARHDVVLADHSSASGNAAAVAAKILTKIAPQQTARQAYSYDRHVFHYVVSDGLVFLCMTDEQFAKRTAFAFLDDVQRR